MKPFTLRRLTPGETALACEVFGAGLDAARVRIFAQSVFPRPFTPGPSLIVYPTRLSRVDFSAGGLADQGAFVHELTHVWQAQRGVFLPVAKLKAGDSLASYAYDLETQTFPQMNIEQQARLVEHDFVLSRQERLAHGALPPFPRRLYDAQRHWWRPT